MTTARRTAMAFLATALVAGIGVSGAGSVPAGSVLLRDRQVSIDSHLPKGSCKQGQRNDMGTGGSCEQPDTEIEPSIAANPEDPLNAVAVFQSGRVAQGGDADNGYAATFDGGQTWIHGLLPGLTKAVGGPFDRASDAVVAFGPGGVVYANSLVFDDTGAALRSGLAVNVSHDGGRTWGAPVIFQDDMGGGAIDKNWIGVDLGTGGGHHPGRVYVVWDRIAPVLAAYSDDEGTTWQTGPSGLGYIVYAGQGVSAIPLILADGSLGVMFETEVAVLPVVHGQPAEDQAEPVPGVSKFVMAKAPAAGSLPTGAPLVFSPPVSVAVNNVNNIRQQRACDGLQSAAVDPKSGQIYVVWTDGRERSDLANDTLISRSDDGGMTWTAPKRVNTGPLNDFVDHWCGMVDVGPSGDVRVAYRTRQEAQQTKPDGSSFADRVDTLYQESFDHGATFGPPMSVTTVDSDMHYAAESRSGAFLGDYDQLAAAGKYTYVVRAEPVRVKATEPHTFPPAYHHQRMWVAVLGPAALREARRAKPPARVLGSKKVRPRRQLPATGAGDGSAGILLLAAAAVLARRALPFAVTR